MLRTAGGTRPVIRETQDSSPFFIFELIYFGQPGVSLNLPKRSRKRLLKNNTRSAHNFLATFSFKRKNDKHYSKKKWQAQWNQKIQKH